MLIDRAYYTGPVVKTLLKTFIFSTILAICVNGILYAYDMQGSGYDHVAAAIRIAEATSVLTFALFIASLPALLLMRHEIWKYPFAGFLLYYTGQVSLVLTFFIMKMDPTIQFFGQLTGLVYLGFSTLFYYMVTRGYRKKFGYGRGVLSSSNWITTRIDPLG